MKNIEILDCTLRDGAQVNEARFGDEALTEIPLNLRDAGLEIIECGFLKNVEFEIGRSYFPQPSAARRYIPEDKKGHTFSALMDFERYDVDHMEEYDGRSFDYIRISLFEKDIKNIKNFSLKVKERGYRISIQPMDTFSYSLDHLHQIIEIANVVRPETLAIVDTYALATTEDVERVYNVYEQNLDSEIKIGFHTHNSQMNSFALAERILQVSNPNRSFVVDSSLYSMGRGGGNLSTELFAEYLNRKGIKNYKMKPILDMIDKYLVGLKQKFEWGYTMPLFYAGLYGVHVHIAEYLSKKPGISSFDLRSIYQMLGKEERKRYDYDYVDTVYEGYLKGKEREYEKGCRSYPYKIN